MRVPLLIRYPGKLKSGTNNLLISTTDLYPTILGLMGMEELIPAKVDGTNLSSLLTLESGEKPSSQWYMKVPVGNPSQGIRGVRTERYTFIVELDNSNQMRKVLFDRETDPYHLKNIANTNQQLEEELMAELKSWLIKNNDPWIKHFDLP